ncbi:MAG: NAD(P)H-dependent oxidoreductase [Paramuribaculum sp.]|nr:NAD(P)H-dependent oxidoreductase [Paramuribaculum sp.]
MKIIAINGSPRKDGNSAKLLQSWVDGFKYLYS